MAKEQAEIQIQTHSGDGDNHRYVVNSASDARKRYVVSRKRQTWACSCPVWIFRRQRCKHVTAVEKEVS